MADGSSASARRLKRTAPSKMRPHPSPTTTSTTGGSTSMTPTISTTTISTGSSSSSSNSNSSSSSSASSAATMTTPHHRTDGLNGGGGAGAAAAASSMSPSTMMAASAPSSSSSSSSAAATGNNSNSNNNNDPSKVRTFSAFVLNRERYNVGSAVAIRPSGAAGASGASQYVGEIVKIQAKPTDNKNVELTVRWYYRPDEIKGGRRPYHGRDELLKSSHMDKCHVATVNGQVRILTFEEYVAGDLDNASQEVYYSREFYDAAKGVIKGKLPLYCICRQPQNPDREMICCDACEDWFHVECVKVTPTEKKKASYICPKCRKKGIEVF